VYFFLFGIDSSGLLVYVFMIDLMANLKYVQVETIVVMRHCGCLSVPLQFRFVVKCLCCVGSYRLIMSNHNLILLSGLVAVVVEVDVVECLMFCVEINQ